MIFKKFSLVSKKNKNKFYFNKKGNCYFVDVFDNSSNLIGSGCYKNKSDAVYMARLESKNIKNRGYVRLHQYSLRKSR